MSKSVIASVILELDTCYILSFLDPNLGIFLLIKDYDNINGLQQTFPMLDYQIL